MNYEIAKKLKDAGFDQKQNGSSTIGHHLIVTEKDAGLPRAGFYLQRDKENVLVPTLSELIEAFGNNFRSIVRADYDPPWQANAYLGNGSVNYAYGHTPEEAVANLWLVLNEK